MAIFGFGKDKDSNTAAPAGTPTTATPAAETATTAPDTAEKAGLFARLKRKLSDDTPAAGETSVAGETLPPAEAPAAQTTATQAKPAPASSTATESDDKAGLFARIKRGLSRTGSAIGSGLGTLLLGKREIDDNLFDELETQLLVADVGIEATETIMKDLTGRVERKELTDGDALYEALQDGLYGILQVCEAPLVIDTARKPFVILVIGVNGAGKTTTIGKLAHRLQREGRSVMLAAGDTFRAAAVEQLQVWGERNNVPVIAQHTGADSASVIFDAVQAAQSRGIDVVIADTAGRLHNKSNLMEELKKVKRVIGKLDGAAPHEVLLVLDAGTGQNAINQAQLFHEAIGVSGIALTKLDGTAKGGVIFGICRTLRLPIRFIGVGEQMADLQVFSARDFIRALFDRSDN